VLFWQARRLALLKHESFLAAHGGDLIVRCIGGNAAIGINLRLAELHLGGESGSAQRLPQVGQEWGIAEPAQLPLRRAIRDDVTNRCSRDGRSDRSRRVNEPGVEPAA